MGDVEDTEGAGGQRNSGAARHSRPCACVSAFRNSKRKEKKVKTSQKE